jgi:hypothetical protein
MTHTNVLTEAAARALLSEVERIRERRRELTHNTGVTSSTPAHAARVVYLNAESGGVAQRTMKSHHVKPTRCAFSF